MTRQKTKNSEVLSVLRVRLLSLALTSMMLTNNLPREARAETQARKLGEGLKSPWRNAVYLPLTLPGLLSFSSYVTRTACPGAALD